MTKAWGGPMRARRSAADGGMPTSDLRLARVGDFVFLSWSPAAKKAVTNAEAATLALVLEGKSNREIARTRGVAERTVANQIASAFRKLGVRSRSELLYQAKASVRR